MDIIVTIFVGVVVACVVAIVFLRQQQKQRFKQDFVASSHLLFDRVRAEYEAREWVNQQFTERYAKLSNEQIETGNIFADATSLFDFQKYVPPAERLAELDALKAQILTTAQNQPQILERFLEQLGVQMSYASNVLEGTQVTELQTEQILNNQLVNGITPQAVDEVVGHHKAYVYVMQMCKRLDGEDMMTLDDILNVHRLVMRFNEQYAGRFRMPYEIARVRGVRVLLAHPLEIPNLMQRLVDKVNNWSGHPLQLVIHFHMAFVQIHGFADGNGRTVRLLCLYLLLRYGYGGFNIHPVLGEKYKTAISEWEQHSNYTPFAELMLSAVDKILHAQQQSFMARCVVL